MNWYEKVKRYYDLGHYTKEQVKMFVRTKKITEEEYIEITEEDYSSLE